MGIIVKRGFQPRFLTLVCGLLFACSNVLSLSAQDDANNEQGIRPFGSYQWNDIDHLNLTNGGLGVSIPLVSHPQRGGVLHLDFNLEYSNAGYTVTTTCQPKVGCLHYVKGSPGGFDIRSGMEVGVGPPSTYYDLYGNPYYVYTLTTTDGSAHVLGQTSGTSSETLDGTGYKDTNAGNRRPKRGDL